MGTEIGENLNWYSCKVSLFLHQSQRKIQIYI